MDLKLICNRTTVVDRSGHYKYKSMKDLKLYDASEIDVVESSEINEDRSTSSKLSTAIKCDCFVGLHGRDNDCQIEESKQLNNGSVIGSSQIKFDVNMLEQKLSQPILSKMSLHVNSFYKSSITASIMESLQAPSYLNKFSNTIKILPDTNLKSNQERTQYIKYNINEKSITPSFFIYNKSSNKFKFINNLMRIIIINYLLRSLTENISRNYQKHQQKYSSYNLLPSLLLAEAAGECKTNFDCRGEDKICHEEKCLCPKHLPIEDVEQERCLSRVELGESCLLNEQCLGDAMCLDGFCSCGTGISIPNPSTNITYCHPKRSLRETCNFDLQCPANSYCSLDKYGCLCHNGYGPMVVKNDDGESVECLQKYCTSSKSCESENHVCQNNMCLCLPNFFDIKSSKCYKHGIYPGFDEDGREELSSDSKLFPLSSKTSLSKGNNNLSDINTKQDSIIDRIFKDLGIVSSMNLFVFLCFFIIVIFLLIALIYIMIRNPFKCWKAQKNEFEPNNNKKSIIDINSTRASAEIPSTNFNKNSINNKSFRRKEEFEDDDHVSSGQISGTASIGNNDEDKSHLVSSHKVQAVPNAGHKTTTTTKTTTTSSTLTETTKLHTSIMIDLTDDDEEEDEKYNFNASYDNKLGTTFCGDKRVLKNSLKKSEDTSCDREVYGNSFVISEIQKSGIASTARDKDIDEEFKNRVSSPLLGKSTPV